MELRQLRYVVTLAETLHFGRAAAREFITQSTFSQQIARLELELGTPLFERSPKHVALTDAGRAFVPRAQRVLEELRQLRDEMGGYSAGASGTLRLGVFAEGAGEMTPLILQAFQESHPGIRIAFTELSFRDQADSLVSRRVDVAILRPPMSDPRVHTVELFAEPRCAALPVSHPLADRDDLSVRDLAGEQMVSTGADVAPEWAAFWRSDEDYDQPNPILVHAASVVESLEAVAHLGAVDTVPASSARRFPHPGVRYVLLRDGALATVAVARRTEDERPLVLSFCAHARQVAEERLDVVPLAVAVAPGS